MRKKPFWTFFVLWSGLALWVNVLAKNIYEAVPLRQQQPIWRPTDSTNRTIWSVDWEPGDNRIATGGVDSTVRIFAANSLRLLKSYQFNSWIHVVKWHPAGKLLAIATLENYVQLLNVETGVIIKLDSSGGARGIGWNYSGELLAVADVSGVIKIFAKNGRLLRTISREYSAEQIGRAFLSLDWHPSKNEFVTANYQLRIFDTTGKEKNTMAHNNPGAIVLCTSWHPSGAFFVVGDYGHNWEGENIPSLLNFWTADGRWYKTMKGSQTEYRNVSWNKEGTRLASASDRLRVWSTRGKLLHRSEGTRREKLWGVDWNSRSNRIVTTNDHGELTIWNEKARLLKTIRVSR